MNLINQGPSYIRGRTVCFEDLPKSTSSVCLTTPFTHDSHKIYLDVPLLASKQTPYKGPDIYLHIPSFLSPDPSCLQPTPQFFSDNS